MTVEKVRAMSSDGVRGAPARTRTERVILAVEAGGTERDALRFEVGYGPVKLGRVTMRDRPDLWARMKAGGLSDSAATVIRLREKAGGPRLGEEELAMVLAELAGGPQLSKGEKAMALEALANPRAAPPEPQPARPPAVDRKAPPARPAPASGGVSARLKLRRLQAAWEETTREGRAAFLAWATDDGAEWRWPYLASQPGDDASAEAFARRTPTGARAWVRHLADAWAEWLDSVVVHLDDIGSGR